MNLLDLGGHLGIFEPNHTVRTFYSHTVQILVPKLRPLTSIQTDSGKTQIYCMILIKFMIY